MKNRKPQRVNSIIFQWEKDSRGPADPFPKFAQLETAPAGAVAIAGISHFLMFPWASMLPAFQACEQPVKLGGGMLQRAVSHRRFTG